MMSQDVPVYELIMCNASAEAVDRVALKISICTCWMLSGVSDVFSR